MRYLAILFVLLIVFVFTSCEKEKEEAPETSEQLPAGMHSVKVIEAMDASDYTYINVDENGKTYSTVVSQIPVKEGEQLYFSKSMEMKNFRSETLNRTFESLLFVDDAKKDMGENRTQMHPVPTTEREEKVSVQKLKGGKSIAEIFSGMKNLNGKIVKVRGKVMKFNP